MTPEKSLKVGPNDKTKGRRSRLLQKWKAEIESESVGLSDYRKMRFARSLYRTQSFCNSWNVTRARPNVIRTVRRMGSSLILESRLFANIILESRLFANVTRIGQRTGYSVILEPRLFAWSLCEGQEPLQLQPVDWIPRMSNIWSIVRNPPKWRSKQSCSQVGFFFSWIE